MYKDEINDLRATWQAGPDSVVWFGVFVLCTIRAGLYGVHGQLADIAHKGEKSKFLWGKKSEGYLWLCSEKERLYSELTWLEENHGRKDPQGIVEAIELLMDCPNLGLAKSAFFLQLLGWEIGCLDSHNLKRLGLPERAFEIHKLSFKARRARILEYVRICQSIGAETLWNDWCRFVAGNRANKFLNTGEKVSRWHFTCIGNSPLTLPMAS